ncbi:MAG: rhomboid family intramembrane serine protease [Maribacter sp.]|nr:MAG: rhomboid family intramembrane serine protease [Maribacter sp.]
MKKNITNILIFIIVLWGIKVADTLLPFDLGQFGIVPRTLRGLIGIVMAPLLHLIYFHLISNTVPAFVLLFVLFSMYKKQAFSVIIGSVLIGGGLVWIFGRSASHIGISGLIYSLAAFLIVAGLLKKEVKSLIASVLIIFLYGGLIWGVFPGRYWISWEGHLFGALAGILIAFVLE